MKLKLPPGQSWYRDGNEIVTPDYDALQRALGMAGSGEFDLLAERLPRFGEIVLQNPGIAVLSDELQWFRREGSTAVSAEQQQFTLDEDGYFQAPASLAPTLLRGVEAKWIGSERPAAEVHHADASRGGADQIPPKAAENATPEPQNTATSVAAWMLALAQNERDQNKRKVKREDAIKNCMSAIGTTWREAEAAYRSLPVEYKNSRGKPKRASK